MFVWMGYGYVNLSVWICLVKFTSHQDFLSELHELFDIAELVFLCTVNLRCANYVVCDLLYRGDAKKSISRKLGATSVRRECYSSLAVHVLWQQIVGGG